MSDLVRLEYRNVTMRFVERSGKSLTAVEGVSLSVGDGEVVSLIGPSGCGKSTLPPQHRFGSLRAERR